MTDTATAPDERRAVVYSVVATHEELIDVLDTALYAMHIPFDREEDAAQFAALFDDRDVVRITIETEWDR